MTNYYYTKNPDVEHNEQNFNFTLLGNELNFTTDNGVFSKRRVDFGSCVLLAALDQPAFQPRKLLDVGCGYGPLGLAVAKKFPQAQVDMVDVNELALSLATKNAVAHGILSQAKDHLVVGGTLTAVLQKKQGAPSAKKKLEEVFGNCQVLKKDKGYFILQSIKEV